MNAFNKKVLVTAVLAGLGGIASTAHAVYVDPDNRGQSLIYPYYTVQGNQNTYISVVNTSTSGVKVVKVRFREGKASNEVLDFNLYLSPADVWAGAVVPVDSTSSTSAAGVVTTDRSCTNPAFTSGTVVPFRNYAYSGDGLGDGLDRTREGYVEIIEMGVLGVANTMGSAAVHGSSGVPTCTGLTGTSLAAKIAADPLVAPTGGLIGSGTIINVAAGSDLDYNATALAAVTAGTVYYDISTDNPNWNDVAVTRSSGKFANGRGYYSTGFTSGADAVSSVLMHAAVINEYVLDSATKSNTDWVMTFPTKNRYVSTTTAVTPFTNKLTTAGACETIGFTFWNREEASVTPAGADFSPLPPGSSAQSLCFESTVVSIRNGQSHMPTGTTSGVLNSVNSVGVNVTTGFQNGWGLMTFTGSNAVNVGIVAGATTTTNLTTGAVSAVAARYLGLPVVGFMTRTFNNNTVAATAGANLSYRSGQNHAFITNDSPTP